MKKAPSGNQFDLNDLLAGEQDTGARSNSFLAKQVDVFEFDKVAEK